MDLKKDILIRKTKYDKVSIVLGIFAIIITFCIMISIILILDEGKYKDEGKILLIFSLIILFILFVVAIIIHHRTESFKYLYRKEYERDFVQKTLESIFDSVSYSYSRECPKSYIEEMDLLGLPLIKPFGYRSCNYLRADYKRKSFIHNDVRIWSGGRGGSDFFYGRILEIEYPLVISVKLKIYSKIFYDIKWRWLPSKSGKIQKTKIKKFDQKIQVRCDSDEVFEQIITPAMIEKLELFYNLYPEFAIEFYDNKLYVAVETGRKSFEPNYSKEVDNLEEIKKIKRDTRFITDTIDIFCRDLR